MFWGSPFNFLKRADHIDRTFKNVYRYISDIKTEILSKSLSYFRRKQMIESSGIKSKYLKRNVISGCNTSVNRRPIDITLPHTCRRYNTDFNKQKLPAVSLSTCYNFFSLEYKTIKLFNAISNLSLVIYTTFSQ